MNSSVKSNQCGRNKCQIMSYNEENNSTDLPNQMLQMKELSQKLGCPRGRCPPRWQGRKTKSQHTTKSSGTESSKRENFTNSVKQVADLSFYMTVSSISSLGDESITSTYEESDPQHDFDNPSLKEALPFLSTRSSNRWDIASQDSLPFSPFRRSFEISNERRIIPITRESSCGDTLPQMPRRRNKEKENP